MNVPPLELLLSASISGGVKKKRVSRFGVRHPCSGGVSRSFAADLRGLLRVNRSSPRDSGEIKCDTDQPRRVTERGIVMKNLYVGNLPHSTTEAELRNLFEEHGAVEKITLVTDRDTGRSRGFGFVEMINASEADKAIAALNGTDLGGRTLTISEAKPKAERPRGGGQRFGGRGGRGRDDYRGHPRQPREPRW
jgi:cold-inducible RNA-binding protein